MRSDTQMEDVLMCTANRRLEPDLFTNTIYRSGTDALAKFGHTANNTKAALDVARTIYSWTEYTSRKLLQ